MIPPSSPVIPQVQAAKTGGPSPAPSPPQTSMASPMAPISPLKPMEYQAEDRLPLIPNLELGHTPQAATPAVPINSPSPSPMTSAAPPPKPSISRSLQLQLLHQHRLQLLSQLLLQRPHRHQNPLLNRSLNLTATPTPAMASSSSTPHLQQPTTTKPQTPVHKPRWNRRPSPTSRPHKPAPPHLSKTPATTTTLLPQRSRQASRLPQKDQPLLNPQPQHKTL